MKTTIRIALAATMCAVLVPCALAGTQAGTLSPATAAELQRLQGSWEGVLEGRETAGKVSITITGNSLFYQGLKPTERYDSTFTLPAGTNPQQLHAMIKQGVSPADSGKMVFAIFKIEKGTLILAGISESAARSTSPLGEDQGFENNSMFRYDLKKVPPMRRAPQ